MIENARLLDLIEDYRGLRLLGADELPFLCAEIRERIIEVTLKNGGHLGASLGAVELIVSLLRTFDPEKDKIVFDVGHQTYAWKILTGRKDRFHTLRSKGGLSGFPRQHENLCDHFDVGHSSTSISAALGYAKARDLQKSQHEVVAVIGDGALLNGIAFEGLNNVRNAKTKLLIVLNDNTMSISPRVGGMAEHLARLSVNTTYRKFKNFIKDQCRNSGKDGLENTLGRVKAKLKSLLLPPNIFEEMDISYWGPFDGHNASELEGIFALSRQYEGPLLIHVITQKGKGCCAAEALPAQYHGVGPGTVLPSPAEFLPPKRASVPLPVDRKPKPLDWSGVMARILEARAHVDERIVALTAAMKDGTKLGNFAKLFPERFFDVGIAEEHMLTFAAGLAAGGLRPVVCIYSTFLQRAYDSLVHDIALQKKPVFIGVDRAGFVGEDGETHMGLLDPVWGRAIPDLIVAAPRDAVDLEYFFSCWMEGALPIMVRYPRGIAPASLARENDSSAEGRKPAPWLKAELLEEGKDICLVGIGSTVKLMLDAAQLLRASGYSPTIVDARFYRPFDGLLFETLMRSHERMIVAEENYTTGGLSEALAAFANRLALPCRVQGIGAPDGYIPHATRSEQWNEYGLTPHAICDRIQQDLSASASSGESQKTARSA